MQAKFADLHGLRTRYLCEGEGFPLLLIYGVGLSADTWLRNIDVLARNFRVIAPDLPGHGFTNGLDFRGQPPHPSLTEHLLRLIDELGIDRLAVAGSSFGALLAALLYFRIPKRVERLIIIGSGASFNTEEEWASVVPKVRQNGLAAVIDPSLDKCRQRMANICFDPASVPEEVLHLQLTSYAIPEVVAGYRQIIDGMADIEATRAYRIPRAAWRHCGANPHHLGAGGLRGIYARAVEAQKLMPNADLSYSSDADTCRFSMARSFQPQRQRILAAAYALRKEVMHV